MSVLQIINKMRAPKIQIIESEIIAFTEGDCWFLALELHKRYDLPVAFMIGSETPEDTEGEDVHWVHAFNALPSGEYIDIQGVHTSKEVYDNWTKHIGFGLPLIVHPTHEVSLKILAGFERYYTQNTHHAADKLNRLHNLSTKSKIPVYA